MKSHSSKLETGCISKGIATGRSQPYQWLFLSIFFSLLGTTTSWGQVVRWVNNTGATRPATVDVFDSNTNTTTTMNVTATTYTTIQSAINAASTNDVVYITNGEYRNTSQPTSTNCSYVGTSQELSYYLSVAYKQILITSETGNHCTSSARLVGFGFNIYGAGNTTIQGLEMDSIRVNAFWNSNCCSYPPSSNVKIRNNKISNTRGHGVKTDSGGPTGEAINRQNWVISGNTFENIGFYNADGYCPTPAPVSALWLAEAGDNFVISNNIIQNTKWAGILCDGYGGVDDQTPPIFSYPGSVTISGNRISNTVDAGIQVGISSASANFYIPVNANINNNTITNANMGMSVSSGAIGILSSNVKGVSITNNDVSSSFNGLAIGIAGWQNSPDVTLVNQNNFYNLSPGSFGVTHIAGYFPNGLFGIGDNLGMYNFENNYWGAANGPTYATNPGGTGVGLRKDTNPLGAGTYSLGEYDFSPYRTTPATVNSVMVVCCDAPSATISYSGSPFCTTAGPVSVTRTGTAGGSYSASPAGLSISSTTGQITPGSSSAGTYTVTYTIAASGGCTAFSTTASVTITTAPSATISYSGSPFCTTSGPVSVTRTGTAGGSYSASPAGLSISSTTGPEVLTPLPRQD